MGNRLRSVLLRHRIPAHPRKNGPTLGTFARGTRLDKLAIWHDGRPPPRIWLRHVTRRPKSGPLRRVDPDRLNLRFNVIPPISVGLVVQ